MSPPSAAPRDWELRAQWFAIPGESNWLESVTREVKTVRSSVGVPLAGARDIVDPVFFDPEGLRLRA